MKTMIKEYGGCMLIVVIAIILGIKFIVDNNTVTGCLWFGIGALYIATIMRSRIQKNRKLN